MRPNLEHHRRSVLFRTLRIAESANVLFLSGSLLVLLLFVLGNLQGFLDRSLSMLLSMVFFLGLLCTATGVFYLVSLVVWTVRRRHLLVFRFLFGLISTGIGAASALGIGILQALIQAT